MCYARSKAPAMSTPTPRKTVRTEAEAASGHNKRTIYVWRKINAMDTVTATSVAGAKASSPAGHAGRWALPVRVVGAAIAEEVRIGIAGTGPTGHAVGPHRVDGTRDGRRGGGRLSVFIGPGPCGGRRRRCSDFGAARAAVPDHGRERLGAGGWRMGSEVRCRWVAMQVMVGRCISSRWRWPTWMLC